MAEELEKYLEPQTLENIGVVISLVRRLYDFVDSLKHNFKVER